MTAKPRRGRPAVTGTTRSTSMLLRITPEEHEELRAAAEREALPLAVWARSRLLLAARRPSPASATTRESS
jgi:hypothetical protein